MALVLFGITVVPFPAFAALVATATPTLAPGSCTNLFNNAESLGVNGTWSGATATRSIVSSAPPGAITENTSALDVNITSPNTSNTNWANLAGFTPSNWSGYQALQVDMYFDPGVWGSGFREMYLFVNGGCQVSSAVLGPYDGPNSLSFWLDNPGGCNLSAVTSLSFEIHTDVAGVGNVYIDNLRLLSQTCPFTTTISATRSLTSTVSATFTVTPTPGSYTATATYTTTPAVAAKNQFLSQEFTYTVQGDYVISTTLGNLANAADPVTVSGVPAGATIVAAYLYMVYWDANGTQNCDTDVTFAGTPLMGAKVGVANFWDTSCSVRFDVKNYVTGNGTYSVDFGVLPAGLENYGKTIVVVYQSASSTYLTTVMIADGLNAWHDRNGVVEAGVFPPDVTWDWCNQVNPVTAPPNLSYSRVGGNAYGGNDLWDQLKDPSILAVEWTSPASIYNVPAVAHRSDLDTYNFTSPGAGGFSTGDCKARSSMDLTDSSKQSAYLAVEVMASRGPLVTRTMTFTVTSTPGLSCSSTGPTTLYACPGGVGGPWEGSGNAWGTTGGLQAVGDSLYTTGGHWSSNYWCVANMTVSDPRLVISSVTAYVTWRGGRSNSSNTLQVDFSVNGTSTGEINPDQVFTYTGNGTSWQTDSVALNPAGGWTPTKLDNLLWAMKNVSGNSPGEVEDVDVAYFVVNWSILCGSPTPTRSRTPTVTWTPTWTPSRTSTPSPTVTLTASPSPTWTVTSTFTFSPTKSFTATNSPTWTNTWTPTFSATPTPTYTVTPTWTPTWTYTWSPSRTWTRTNTPTFTATSTPTYSATPTPTYTWTPTWTNTWTYTFSPTRSYTATWTPTFTFTSTPTFSVTYTPTFSWTPTATATWTYTFSPTRSFTSTWTPTFTNTSTPTFSASPTATPTITMTATPTNTHTPLPTLTFTATQTPTYTPSSTPTYSASPTATPTWTPTFTATPTWTPTRTNTWTPTWTLTFTPTPTWTPTATSTNSMSPTFTSTWTPTATWSPTLTWTRTNTPTWTSSSTPTYSATPSWTPTWTPTATDTSTHTPLPTLTFTRTNTPTFTWTLTATPSASPTFSATPTSTSTWTPTFTVTPTWTPTWTNTNSMSPTFTSTWTPTATWSPTATWTPTWTPTATATYTHTPLPTLTFTTTPTNTFTVTPTSTVTPTWTPTWTSTNSMSPTHTSTDSPTDTDTPTSTWTPTDTPTFTDTPTATPTWTPTDSMSPTHTSTDSPTSTWTPTDTETDTPTATPTWTPTATATDTPKDTQTSTDTPTWTPTSTPTATPTDSMSPTDTSTGTPTSTWTPTWTLTATPTNSVSATSTSTDSPTSTWTGSTTASPTLTATATPSPTATPTFTSSATSTASATPTASSTLTPTSTWSPTPTNSPSATATRTWSPSRTASATFTPTPKDLVQVKVSVYNEAGEEVGVISDGLIFDQAVEEFFFSQNQNVITDKQNSLAIVFPDNGVSGPVTLAWSGLGFDGQPLANGAYVVKVESVDSLGLTTVITGSATILRSGATVTVSVFNEAGELVWSQTVPAAGVSISQVSVQGDSVDPGLAAGSPGAAIEITAGSTTLTWDGKDSSGAILANGVYLVEVHVQSGGQDQVITQNVTVLHGDLNEAGSVVMAPNPALGPVEIRIQPGLSPILRIKVKIYTVSGELIRHLEASGDSLIWDLKDPRGSLVSGGLYLLVVDAETAQGGIQRHLGRLVVIR